MKSKLLFAAFLGLTLNATTTKAQLNVGGTTAPDASAQLQVTGGLKGLRLPQVNLSVTTTYGLTAATNADSAKGMIVYNKSAALTGTTAYPAKGEGAYTWDGTGWLSANGAAGDNLGNHSATQDLVLNNNTLILGAAGDLNHKMVYEATVGGPLITGWGGGTLGTERDSSLSVLTWKNTGNVGIGITAPTNPLQVARDKATYGGNGQIVATGATDPRQALVLGYNTTLDKGFVQSIHNGVTYTDLMLQPTSGNTGIGAIPDVTSKLEVNGSSTNYISYAAPARVINFLLSNLAYTPASAAGTFTLTGIKDGGTYSLAVRGTVSGTALFASTGFTVKYANNRATEAGTETVYTLVVMGTTVYVYTSTGF